MKRTPLKAIRAHCLLCMNGNHKFLRECSTPRCPTLPFRMGRRVPGQSPLKAIRQLCLDCQGGSAKEVQECDPNLLSGERCPLYEYRLGKTSRKLSEAEREQRQNASPFLGEKRIFDQEEAAHQVEGTLVEN